MKHIAWILLSFTFGVSHADQLSLNLEGGNLSSLGTESGEIGESHFYIEPRAVYESELGSESGLVLRGSFRGRVNVIDNNQNDAEIRALNASYQDSLMTLTVGFQEISWGETFGIYISDLVNPRDFRDPLLTDQSWRRLPTFTANSEFFVDQWSFQFLWTPIPRESIVGESINGIPVLKENVFSLSDFPEHSEVGGRIGYTFDGGFDVTAFFLSHWNRNPVYELIPSGESAALSPILKRVSSVGVTGSQAWDSLVLRADLVTQVDSPESIPQTRTLITATQYDGILGLDYTTESEWTFGGQYQYRYRTSEGSKLLNWASLQIQKPFDNRKWIAEVFGFFGTVNNSDVWVQPKVTYSVTDQIQVSLRADLLAGNPNEGLVGPLRDQDRILTWLKMSL